jgi:hypothetical protein
MKTRSTSLSSLHWRPLTTPLTSHSNSHSTYTDIHTNQAHLHSLSITLPCLLARLHGIHMPSLLFLLLFLTVEVGSSPCVCVYVSIAWNNCSIYSFIRSPFLSFHPFYPSSFFVVAHCTSKCLQLKTNMNMNMTIDANVSEKRFPPAHRGVHSFFVPPLIKIKFTHHYFASFRCSQTNRKRNVREKVVWIGSQKKKTVANCVFMSFFFGPPVHRTSWGGQSWTEHRNAPGKSCDLLSVDARDDEEKGNPDTWPPLLRHAQKKEEKFVRYLSIFDPQNNNTILLSSPSFFSVNPVFVCLLLCNISPWLAGCQNSLVPFPPLFTCNCELLIVRRSKGISFESGCRFRSTPFMSESAVHIIRQRIQFFPCLSHSLGVFTSHRLPIGPLSVLHYYFV